MHIKRDRKFAIEIKKNTILLKGNVDVSRIAQIDESVAKITKKKGVKTLTVDFKMVEHINNEVIHYFLDISDRMHAQKIRILFPHFKERMVSSETDYSVLKKRSRYLD